MAITWTYKDDKDNIDELEWLTNYVRNNYHTLGGLRGVNIVVVSKFKCAFPRRAYKKEDGTCESEEEINM